MLVSSRRDIKSMLGPEFSACSLLDQIDKSVLDHALVLFTSSSMYLGMSLEPIRGIGFSRGTLFATTNTTLAPEKIVQMFGPSIKVLPFYPSDLSCENVRDQGSCWDYFRDSRTGCLLPDLGIFLAY